MGQDYSTVDCLDLTKMRTELNDVPAVLERGAAARIFCAAAP